jgi:uncharacterized protein YraI
MIEVIGRDGRVHNFADGTSQAQIDAAMAAIYDALPAAARIQAPPVQEPPPYYREPAHVEPPPAGGANKVLIGSVAAAGVVGLVAIAYLMGRGGPAPEPNPQATSPAAAVTPTDPTNAVDPNVALPVVPGAPNITAEAFAGFVATAQGGNLTVRAQPQTSGAELAKLPHGAPISVIGSVMMPDGLWRQVNVAGTTGFVKGEYISQTQPAAIVRAPPPPPAKILPRDFYGVISTMNSDSVNLRATPSTSAASLAALKPSSEVRVIGEQGNWYQVEYGGRRGWVRSDLVAAYD